MRFGWTVALWCTLAGCPATQPVDTDTDPPPVGPMMELDPLVVDFGEQAVGRAATPIEVEVFNHGDQPLDVYSIEIQEPGVGYSLGTVGQSQRIEVDSRGTFVVHFKPQQPTHYGTELLIDSNDSQFPQRHMPISGYGVSPELSVDPAVVKIATPTEAARIPLVLRNPGGVTLDITDIVMDGDEGLAVDIDAGRNGELPFELEPLDEASDKPTRTIYATWTPTGSDTAAGVITLTSDDYAHKELKVPVTVE